MQRVAVVGQKDFINIFKMVGCETFLVKTKKEAVRLIEQLIVEEFVLIFITSSLAKQIPKTIKRHSLSSVPIISQIPG